eukprot:13382947-Alexandrium_andersonii.AAC.1
MAKQGLPAASGQYGARKGTPGKLLAGLARRLEDALRLAERGLLPRAGSVLAKASRAFRSRLAGVGNLFDAELEAIAGGRWPE